MVVLAGQAAARRELVEVPHLAGPGILEPHVRTTFRCYAVTDLERGHASNTGIERHKLSENCSQMFLDVVVGSGIPWNTVGTVEKYTDTA